MITPVLDTHGRIYSCDEILGLSTAQALFFRFNLLYSTVYMALAISIEVPTYLGNCSKTLGLVTLLLNLLS